jgi:cytochrome c oxidase subunit II
VSSATNRLTRPANLARPRWRFPAGAAALVLLSGCDGVLDPQGPRAAPLADIWWFMLAVSTAVTVLVIVLLLVALVVAHRRDRSMSEVSRGLWGMVIGLGVVLPLVVVTILAVWSLDIDRSVMAESDDDLVIEVVAHQFWWEVRYPDLDVVTANEIHIPVGRPVRVELTSEDVIHAFWVPQLAGKADAVPGRSNHIYLEAAQAGHFRGQCAEFCGIQHANMRILVLAEEPGDFEAWVEHMQQPAEEPDEELLRGHEVFVGAGCAACHTVDGHEAAEGRLGPDLTHLMSRRTIAAGTLPNTRGNLGGWVLRPNDVKPGVLMPATQLSPEELQALLDYLESLE